MPVTTTMETAPQTLIETDATAARHAAAATKKMAAFNAAQQADAAIAAVHKGWQQWDTAVDKADRKFIPQMSVLIATAIGMGVKQSALTTDRHKANSVGRLSVVGACLLRPGSDGIDGNAVYSTVNVAIDKQGWSLDTLRKDCAGASDAPLAFAALKDRAATPNGESAKHKAPAPKTVATTESAPAEAAPATVASLVAAMLPMATALAKIGITTDEDCATVAVLLDIVQGVVTNYLDGADDAA